MAKSNPFYLRKMNPTGNRSVTEALGQLYNIHKKIDNYERQKSETSKDFHSQEELEKEKRHKELVDALSKIFQAEKKEKKKTEVKEKEKKAVKEKKEKKKREVGSATLAFIGGAAYKALQDFGIIEKKEDTTTISKTQPKETEPFKPKEYVPPEVPEPKPTAPAQAAEPAKVPPEPTKPSAEPVRPSPGAIEKPKAEKLPMPREEVATAIDKASKAVGVDKSLMYAIAKQESAFNPAAAAAASTAKGLYQFINKTWKSMVERYGDKFPILKQRSPTDPEANALAGALYIKENSEILKSAGIPVDATSIYASHFLGAGGAKKLFSMKPDELVAPKMPEAASANRNIFYKSNGEPKTASEIIDTLYMKVGKYESQYRVSLGEQGTAVQMASAKPDLNAPSIENQDLKKTATSSSTILVNNNNNTILQPPNKNVTVVAASGKRESSLELQQRG